jgi:hypothetical protein
MSTSTVHRQRFHVKSKIYLLGSGNTIVYCTHANYPPRPHHSRNVALIILYVLQKQQNRLQQICSTAKPNFMATLQTRSVYRKNIKLSLILFMKARSPTPRTLSKHMTQKLVILHPFPLPLASKKLLHATGRCRHQIAEEEFISKLFW